MDVVLASTQSDLRVALEILLREEPGVQVVGTASEAESLRALLQAARPDLVLLDWDLPCHSPADLVTEAKSLPPGPRVIVLGRDYDTKPAARAAGANAFVLKGDPPRRLLAAVRQMQPRRASAEISDSIERKEG
jgi:DNA-binding NarL/FixJ family response regulator